MSDSKEATDALSDQINAAMDEDESPIPTSFPSMMSFRAESEEIPPEESRYILVAHKNCFPEKNIFSYAELRVLLTEGIQISIKK